MKSKVGCLKPRLAALAIVTSLLSACATVSSEPVDGVCPAVVEYSRDEQHRAAAEIEALPEGAVIVDWLANYAVLRDQAQMCSRVR